MTCRTEGCRRAAHPDSPYCDQCIGRILAEAFGRTVREAVPVRRLSDQLFPAMRRGR